MPSYPRQVRAHLHGSAIERRAREPARFVCALVVRDHDRVLFEDVGPSKAHRAAPRAREASATIRFFSIRHSGRQLAEVGDLKGRRQPSRQSLSSCGDFLSVHSEQAESHTRDGASLSHTFRAEDPRKPRPSALAWPLRVNPMTSCRLRYAARTPCAIVALHPGRGADAGARHRRNTAALHDRQRRCVHPAAVFAARATRAM